MCENLPPFLLHVCTWILPPPLGFAPNLQAHFAKQGPGARRKQPSPCPLWTPTFLKTGPHRQIPQPSPKHNRGGGCWRRDVAFWCVFTVAA